MSTTVRADAVIIGGGISGLIAAIELNRLGISTTIIEKARRIGGRVQSDRHNGFTLDRGFQVLLTAYPEARRYLDYEALNLCRFPRGASVLTDDGILELTDPRENMTTAIKSFGKILHAKDLPGLWRLSRVSGRPEPDDRSSTAAYLANADFSDTLRSSFLEPFLRGILLDAELGAPIQNVSFYMEMFAKGHAAVPARGIDQIPLQLAEQLTNCQLLLDRTVVAIDRGLVHLADGSAVTGDALVLALDAYHLGKLTGHSSPANFHPTTCHYYNAPADDVAGLMPLVLNGQGDGPINHLSIPTIASDQYAPPGRALIGANSIGDDASEPRSAVEIQLNRWFGDHFHNWEHLRSVKVDHALPAQQDQHAWHEFGKVVEISAGTAFGGPTAVAGDFTTTASLNGAMASGSKAAHKIATGLKVSRSL